MSTWDEMDDEDRRPARRLNRRRRDDDDFDDRREPSSSVNTNKIILIILGCVGVLMLACGGMAFYFISSVKKAVDKAQAAQASQASPFKYVGTQTKPSGSGTSRMTSAAPPKLPDAPETPGEIQVELSNLRVVTEQSGIHKIHFDYQFKDAGSKNKVYPVVVKCGERWFQTSLFVRTLNGTFSTTNQGAFREPIARPISIWVLERSGANLTRISEKLTIE